VQNDVTVVDKNSHNSQYSIFLVYTVGICVSIRHTPREFCNLTHTCRHHTRACQNHTLRVENTIVHIVITLELVEITLLRVEITLICV
jgi:hypothetical protein